MKKFSIRFVSIILSLILVISSLPLTVLSASAADGDTATTNLAASDVAYCGTGVGTDSSNKYCVRFPEQGYTAIKHCEFTFTGTVSGNQAVGTFSSDALGYTNYVNVTDKAQQPLKTTADTLTVDFNTGINGTVSISSINSSNKKIYLFFRDEEYSDDKQRYMFDRAGLHGTQTAFSLFVRESGNTTSGINGYKRVQNINEIKQGEKYLIAHPGKYDRNTSNAADGSAWYVLHPSKSDENYVQVAKVYNTVLSSKAKRVQNGSFEYNADGSPYVQASGNQPQSHAIQAWNTTAEENKVELFNKTSTAHMSASDSAKNYIPDGKYAAELNADEPGSLYQVVNTMPSSAYLWGLDHSGRSGADTMALVIGPNQEVRPSKNSGSTNSETTSSTTKKNYGKDQFMQMVEWAKSQAKITLPDYSKSISGNEPQNITVYSKPFGLNGSFKSNDELSPFSLVPTDEHTEEWHIWIMTSGNSDWSSYGSNDEENGINTYGNINSSDMEKLKQYFYRVPAGQTESMFAFVPIDTAHQHRGNKTTLGNLLDNVNFEVFNSFTASSTNHGAGSLTDNDNGHADNQDITDTHPISVYTKDNSTQNLVAEIKKEDSGKDVTFAGVYLTTQNAKGESVTVFKPLKNCEIEVNEDDWKKDPTNEKRQTATVTLNGKQVVVSRLLTDNKGYVYDIPADMWLKTTDSNGNTDYVMQIKNVSSSMDAHFIFLKSPTVTYDANSISGFEYKISDTNTTNVYNFEPIANADGVKYIDPVSSRNPDAPNDGWKFTGWKLFDTNGVVKYDNGNDVILSGTNAIACNTTQPNGQPTERTFVVVDGQRVEDDFNEGVDVVDSKNAIIGKEWTVKDSAKDSVVYENESEALSLVAQWRFKNTFTPEYQNNVTDTGFTQGETGGTIELKNTDSENYSVGENGTKSYFAGVGEQVVATAKANSLYTFIGWYDSEGNVVTTNPELVVNQVKGEIGKYHARFQKTGVTVNFYYLEYNKDTKSYEPKVYDSGKHNQYLNKYDSATKPTGDSKNVKTWYTSRTNLGADTAFDFNKTLDKSIDLYAAPAFTFNYLNQFQFAEPWRMITYATLKYDGKYIDMKTDPDVTDYKVYILKASSVDEKQPTSADIKKNATLVVKKDAPEILFNSTTKTGETFNRVGAQYNNLHIFDMKTPVWVTFEFTYRGITYTANVKNRSLYNNIDTYMKTTGQQYYTEYSEQQKAVLDAINKMYDATAKYNITEATPYHSSVSVSDEVKNSVKAPEEGYTFNSSTTIRNIEPWGFKYSFSVNGKALSNYSDYGVVVLSGADNEPADARELVNNEKAVMYSKSGGNIYGVENDANTAAAYHVNGITIANYDKKTYAVFFVRDSSGDYHYSSVISNSYKDIAEKDTSDSKAVSTAILDYAQKYRTYVDAISSKNN